MLGLTNNEIAETLHYSVPRVSQLINHPDIAESIERLRATVRERSLGSLQDDLATDARNTFDKLRLHRDDEDADVSLRACGMLWDRQIPKRVESKEEHTIRIMVSAEDRRYLEQVADEDDRALEAAYTVEEAPHGPTSPD